MKAQVHISRFNPHQDASPSIQTYEYELSTGMTVLDVLNYIHDNVDSTFCYSYCCRNGHCGLCAINIDKKPALACRKGAYDGMTLEPLLNFHTLKDLVIDRNDYERLRPKMRLFLERHCENDDEPEMIDMEMFEHFKVASRCIECYSCVSICPVYKKSPHSFVGPAALVLEARHLFDCRDEGSRSLTVLSEGVQNCIQCGLCSKVCSVNAQPCETIGLMIKLTPKEEK